MPKWLRWTLFSVALAVFVFSVWKLISIYSRYAESRNVYSAAADQFTGTAAPDDVSDSGDVGETGNTGRTVVSQSGEKKVLAPITVDFQALLEVNPDVIGWIYCQDSVINYPVMEGATNSTYLHTDYRGEYDPGGSIFADAANDRTFADSNTILYGHHMQDMSMLASLEYWMEQDYYDTHPVMWLLTPEQDYRVDLFACYVTTATEWEYTIYKTPCEGFDGLMERALERSAFVSGVAPDSDSRVVMLSTCEYSYELARTVVFGVLVPVDSAGGFLLDP